MPPDEPLPPSLLFLKRLVTVLTLTMIVGVITILFLLVTRMPRPGLGLPPTIPQSLEMPAKTEAEAVTLGRDWVAVVTKDGRILIFGLDGKLWQEVKVTRPAT